MTALKQCANMHIRGICRRAPPVTTQVRMTNDNWQMTSPKLTIGPQKLTMN